MDDLKQVLEKNKEKYIQKLAELVAIDTHDIGHGIEGGLEAKGQEYLIKMFEEMGAEVKTDQLREEVIQKSLAAHQEGNLGHNYDGRYNVYAKFAGNRGKSILFNGHIDTMPTGDEKLWDTLPHDPAIRDGRMYGLGVCDMKGGLMASVMAVQLLRDAEAKLPGDVIITSVVDEEGGGNGSIFAAMQGQKADAVVVCEPTDRQIVTALMGWVFFKIEIEGLAVHSGSKWLGVSAIEKAVKIMAAIDELEHQWLMTYKHPSMPSPTSNVGVIEGGTAGSTVASDCCLKTCVHYPPTVISHDQVVEMYTQAIRRACDADEWLKDHRPVVSVYQAGNSCEMESNHPLVGTFCGAVRKVTGREVIPTGVPYGTDARIWKNIAGCPTVQYGPGCLAQCHAANEYLPLDQYLESILIYAQFILDWCKN